MATGMVIFVKNSACAGFPCSAPDRYNAGVLSGTVGRYRILKPLGSGGMGEVYKAYDSLLDRHVAIKSAHPHRQSSAVQEQVRREARAAAAVDHPNVARIYDVLSVRDRIFLVLEYIEGETLLQRLQRGPIELEEALRIGLEVAEGLSAAHSKRIVHRDLKLANVMITKNGSAKILDFGLAKLADHDPPPTEPVAEIIGTLSAMSPEQLGSGPVDHRSDLFSLGSLLYELVTGNHPFRGVMPPITACNIVSHEPDEPHKLNPEVPIPISKAICRLLEKNPLKRPDSALELIRILQPYRRQTTAAHGSVIRRPWLTAASVSMVVVLVSMLLLGWCTPIDPLYVELTVAGAEESPSSLQLLAEGVRLAASELLASMPGVYPVRPVHESQTGGELCLLAPSEVVHEVLSTTITEQGELCLVTFEGIEQQRGTVRWTAVSKPSVNDPIQLVRTVTSKLQQCYSERCTDTPACGLPQADESDLLAYLEICCELRRGDQGSTDPRQLLRRLTKIRRSSRFLAASLLEAKLATSLLDEPSEGCDSALLEVANQAVARARELAPQCWRPLVAEVELACISDDPDRARQALVGLRRLAPHYPPLLSLRDLKINQNESLQLLSGIRACFLR